VKSVDTNPSWGSKEGVLQAADKYQSYQANVGFYKISTALSEKQRAFAEQWQEENAPISGINNGHGILQDLFIRRKTEQGHQFYEVVEEINNRDRMIVATVIQWLGSNIGMGFLMSALAKFGAKISLKGDQDWITAQIKQLRDAEELVKQRIAELEQNPHKKLLLEFMVRTHHLHPTTEEESKWYKEGLNARKNPELLQKFIGALI
jgi:hypothetical protein